MMIGALLFIQVIHYLLMLVGNQELHIFRHIMHPPRRHHHSL